MADHCEVCTLPRPTAAEERQRPGIAAIFNVFGVAWAAKWLEVRCWAKDAEACRAGREGGRA